MFVLFICSFTVCDKCTLTLLDDLQEMDDNLNKDATHVLDFEVHAPWPKLEVIEKDLNELNDRYDNFEYSKDKIVNFNETLLDKVRVFQPGIKLVPKY